MNTVRAYTSPETDVVYSMTYDESLNDQIPVVVVPIGLDFGA